MYTRATIIIHRRTTAVITLPSVITLLSSCLLLPKSLLNFFRYSSHILLRERMVNSAFKSFSVTNSFMKPEKGSAATGP